MMRMLLAVSPPLFIVLVGVLLAYLSSWLALPVLLFGAADAFGRWNDYRYLARFGYLTERLALYYGKSFCGRWVVCAVDPSYWRFYWSRGYRPWHFLPDGFPVVLFNSRFWTALAKGHRA